MTRYALRKLLALPVMLLVVSAMIFFCVRLLPGDPARMIAGPEASAEAVTRIHHQLGLDQPVGRQYLDFLTKAASGDLGASIATDRPVVDELAEHAPYTLALGLAAYTLAVLIAVPGGVLAAAAPGGAWDRVFSGVSILCVSIASLWFGLMAMELFAVRLRWLPLMGAGSPAHLILPAVTLALAPIGLLARMTRASMLEVLAQDYIRTARAKGVGRVTVLVRHALRNALTPIVTIVGLNLGAVIGGAVVTETVFSWPGLGQLLVSAVRDRDYPVVQGVALAAVVSVVLLNLAAELAIAALNPRIRAA
jgi:glutathione transport system permease protein